ncbi:MAG: SH3 domain-containing protein [Chloroflexota bacterium]
MRNLLKRNLLKLTSVLTVILLSCAVAEALCVKVQVANMRSGPGTHYSVLWEVNRHMPFVKVGRSSSGDWYAVRDLENDVMWIHKSLVTNHYRCAVVKSDKVNIRKGPGTKYAKSNAGPAMKYYSFKVLKTKGQWVRVKNDWEGEGWIHRDHLWMP